MIDGKQGKMLISLLDKPTKKIKIDQLIKDEKNGRKLLIEADEVLDETKRHYQSQFRSRNFDQNILKERWAKNYEPKKEIDEEWYQSLDQNILEEEWSEMLEGLKKNTAPGMSGIMYSLIQAGSVKSQEIFRTFAEICI